MKTINTITTNIDTKHTNINQAIHADAKPAEQILDNKQEPEQPIL